MAGGKTRRVEARITLVRGDLGGLTSIRPGQTVDLPAGEAEALISRGFARAASTETAPLPKSAPPKKVPDGGDNGMG
ncbi:hypothetical protein [Roseospira navarrensis]|uniref:Uncharacterized protein n=1 Tax=Roseospira navarrensis TaxID=140058 RepID=A0A7X2D4H8_9PROT|nr:hypothetical protein [Roseospira navarrensis]MQX37881.1 hypothetical protein [Roseospira navarrensis]